MMIILAALALSHIHDRIRAANIVTFVLDVPIRVDSDTRSVNKAAHRAAFCQCFMFDHVFM